MPVDFRQQVHEQALEAAERMLVADGWAKLRFGDVAAAIGVSRPSLYAAFANKEALGEALVRRETDRFLAGIHAVLEAHVAEPPTAVREAIAYTFAEAERSPVLHAVLTSSQDGLLPFLTTRSRPLLDAASAVLGDWLIAHTAVDPQDVAEGVDVLVRLVVSHLVLPADDPTRTPDKVARVALSYLT